MMNKENRLIYFSGPKEVPKMSPAPSVSTEELTVFKEARLVEIKEVQNNLAELHRDAEQKIAANKDPEGRLKKLNAENQELLGHLEQIKKDLEKLSAANISAVSTATEVTMKEAERIFNEYPKLAPDAGETGHAQAVEKAREDKAQKAKSAIELGWEKSNEIDDYDNETISLGTLTVAGGAAAGLASPVPLGTVIGAGLGAAAGALDIAPEILTKGLNKTRHLYGGVLSGIDMTGAKTDELTDSVDEIMNAETKTDRTLDARHIEEALSEAGVSIKSKELDHPEFTRIKGYVLGLLYGAKKSLSPDQFGEYKKALEEKINKKLARSLAATYNKKADEWFSFAGEGVEEAMKKAINALPTPQEWLAEQEAAKAPAAPAVASGKAPAAGTGAAGAASGSATQGKSKRASSKGRERTSGKDIDKGINAGAFRANKKLMEKWTTIEKKVGKEKENELERDIKDALGYKPEESPDYGSREFAERIKKFQKEHGLDMQDGIIGDQTMTAILDMAKEKTKNNEEKAKFESYFKDGKVKRREAQYYSLRGAARSGGGRKRPAAAAAAAAATETAATEAPAAAKGREPAMREAETAAIPAGTPAAGPSAAPAAAPAPAPAAAPIEAREEVGTCGEYCQIIETTLKDRNQESVDAIVNKVTQKLASAMYFDLYNDYLYIDAAVLTQLIRKRLEAASDYLLTGVEKEFNIKGLAITMGTAIEKEYIPKAKDYIEKDQASKKKPAENEIKQAVEQAFSATRPEAKLYRLAAWLKKIFYEARIDEDYKLSLDDQALLSRYVEDPDPQKAKSSIVKIFKREIDNKAKAKAESLFKEAVRTNEFI